jgi:hypothetical protein
MPHHVHDPCDPAADFARGVHAGAAVPCKLPLTSPRWKCRDNERVNCKTWRVHRTGSVDIATSIHVLCLGPPDRPDPNHPKAT